VDPLEQAQLVGADLIVIGNLRMQGAKRVLGAVANDILHHAPCDVLCVKDRLTQRRSHTPLEASVQGAKVVSDAARREDRCRRRRRTQPG
jgi:hypothetical protein